MTVPANLAVESFPTLAAELFCENLEKFGGKDRWPEIKKGGHIGRVK